MTEETLFTAAMSKFYYLGTATIRAVRFFLQWLISRNKAKDKTDNPIQVGFRKCFDIVEECFDLIFHKSITS